MILLVFVERVSGAQIQVLPNDQEYRDFWPKEEIFSFIDLIKRGGR